MIVDLLVCGWSCALCARVPLNREPLALERAPAPAQRTSVCEHCYGRREGKHALRSATSLSYLAEVGSASHVSDRSTLFSSRSAGRCFQPEAYRDVEPA